MAGSDFSALGDRILEGPRVRLEPLDWARHERGLAAALTGPENADIWSYMSIGPFEAAADFRPGFSASIAAAGLKPVAILDRASSAPLGMASFMRIAPAHRSAEVGFVAFSYDLQRTAHATEAIFLMIDHAMRDHGCRRFEWKCNAENTASRRAALRFGFTFEGVFRQHMIVKGKNRDTAWFSILDSDWPRLRERYNRWLHPENFDADGHQIKRLQNC